MAEADGAADTVDSDDLGGTAGTSTVGLAWLSVSDAAGAAGLFTTFLMIFTFFLGGSLVVCAMEPKQELQLKLEVRNNHQNRRIAEHPMERLYLTA